MTAKTPVYWRTKDDKKAVIIKTYKEDKNRIDLFVIDLGVVRIFVNTDELTEWKEPVTREVWVQLWKNGSVRCGWDKIEKNDPKFAKLASQIKRTITEGEFDE